MHTTPLFPTTIPFLFSTKNLTNNPLQYIPTSDSIIHSCEHIQNRDTVTDREYVVAIHFAPCLQVTIVMSYNHAHVSRDSLLSNTTAPRATNVSSLHYNSKTIKCIFLIHTLNEYHYEFKGSVERSHTHALTVSLTLQ